MILSKFIITDLGFRFDQSKSLVLSIIYSNEEQIHNDQSGVILYISKLNYSQINSKSKDENSFLTPRFHIGTTVIGNNRKSIRK